MASSQHVNEMDLRKNRENTFRIDFSNVPKKPSFKEVHRFIARELDLPREQVTRIQINNILGCVFVKTIDTDTAEQIVQQHDNRHEYVCNKQKYKIPIQMEDGLISVKLNDLSEDISDAQISEHMQEFGDVISIIELKWGDEYEYAGLPTGTRLVKMRLKHPIKSYLSIDGEITRVVYPGQRATCRHCGEYVHIGIPCVQNKKLLVQKVSANERLSSGYKANTYAEALKVGARRKQPRGNDHIEILDDEIADAGRFGDLAPTHQLTVDQQSKAGNSSTHQLTKSSGSHQLMSQLCAPSGSHQLTSQLATSSGSLQLTPQHVAPLIHEKEVVDQTNNHQQSSLAAINPPETTDSGQAAGDFKEPLDINKKHKRDDGSETDGSTASSGSKKGRPRGAKSYRTN